MNTNSSRSEPDHVSDPIHSIEQEATLGSWGVDTQQMDSNIHPGNNFFCHAPGKWLRTYHLPPEKSAFGSFDLVREQVESQLLSIVDDCSNGEFEHGSAKQQIADYFASFVDCGHIDSSKLTSIEEEFQRIGQIATLNDLYDAFGRSSLENTATPIAVGVSFNRKNPDRSTVSIRHSGLGLPDRDYYLEDIEKFKSVREAYLENIETMLLLVQIDDAKAAAHRILDLETKVAHHHWTRADRRDRDKTLNPMTITELESTFPNFGWQRVFEASGLTSETVNVDHPSAIGPLSEIVVEIPLNTWREYLIYHLLIGNSFMLPSIFEETRFSFFGSVLEGKPKQKERWKRAIYLVGGNNGLGMLLGRLYVDKYFPPDAKAKIDRLVQDIRDVYKARLERLEWMGNESRSHALKKLEAIGLKIAYPDTWIDFQNININKNDLAGNIKRLRLFWRKREIERLNSPTDRSEWFMTPHTVNACYDGSLNEIVFPAGILQPPFFDPYADAAVNYGAIGTVIAHEFGHGFDDQGSKMNDRGVQENWWTTEDRKNFERRTRTLADQFSTYEPLEGIFIDGNFTLGENIGDLGGVQIAYEAYRKSLRNKETPVIDGYTGDQRFFLSYAQIWRYKSRPETTISRVMSDPHSPPQFRVNGIVRNVDSWYRAFDVKASHTLYLPVKERITIW